MMVFVGITLPGCLRVEYKDLLFHLNPSINIKECTYETWSTSFSSFSLWKWGKKLKNGKKYISTSQWSSKPIVTGWNIPQLVFSAKQKGACEYSFKKETEENS